MADAPGNSLAGKRRTNGFGKPIECRLDLRRKQCAGDACESGASCLVRKEKSMTSRRHKKKRSMLVSILVHGGWAILAALLIEAGIQVASPHLSTGTREPVAACSKLQLRNHQRTH